MTAGEWEITEAMAFEVGKLAFTEGRRLGTNPYPLTSLRAEMWFRGWLAQSQIAGRATTGTEQLPRPRVKDGF